MNRTDAPTKQAKPFGVNGQREPLLPTTPSGDNTASYEQGFPPITMILKSAGGLPPKGQDMNQILFELSSLNRWGSTGALNSYDASFSTAIGGYPKGSVLLSDDGNNIYVNTIDSNQTNPNSSGLGWLTFVNFIGAVSASGGSYNADFKFKSVGTIPTEQNGVSLVTPSTAAPNGFANWMLSEWYDNKVLWGILRGGDADATGAGIQVMGLLFSFLSDGTMKSGNETVAFQNWVESNFPLKTSLGTASTKNIGTGTNQIPDMNSFQSGSNANGAWFKLPSGLLIQYGLLVNTSTTGYSVITFPTPFASQPSFSIAPTSATPTMVTSSGTSETQILGVQTFNLQGNQLNNGVSWIAIGV